MAILDSSNNMILILATTIPCAVILVLIMGILHCIRKRRQVQREARKNDLDSELGSRGRRLSRPMPPPMTINTNMPPVRRFEIVSAPVRPQSDRLSRNHPVNAVPSNNMLGPSAANRNRRASVHRMSSMLSPTSDSQSSPTSPFAAIPWLVTQHRFVQACL